MTKPTRRQSAKRKQARDKRSGHFASENPSVCPVQDAISEESSDETSDEQEQLSEHDQTLDAVSADSDFCVIEFSKCVL